MRSSGTTGTTSHLDPNDAQDAVKKAQERARQLFARNAENVTDELQQEFQKTGKCSLKEGDIALVEAALTGANGRNYPCVSLSSPHEKVLGFLKKGNHDHSNDQAITDILNLFGQHIGIIERRNGVNYGLATIVDFLKFLEEQFDNTHKNAKDAVVNAFLSTKLAQNLSTAGAGAKQHAYNLVQLFKLYPTRQSELLDAIGLDTFLKRLVLGVTNSPTVVSLSLAHSALRRILPCVTDDNGQGNPNAIFQNPEIIKKICDGIAAFASKAPTADDTFDWKILHEIITATPKSSSTATAAPASGMTLFSSPQRPATVSAMETVQAHLAALRTLLPTLNETDRAAAIKTLSELLDTASRQELK